MLGECDSCGDDDNEVRGFSVDGVDEWLCFECLDYAQSCCTIEPLGDGDFD